MISSIFGKTKPINFIILLGFLFVFYWCVQFYLLGRDISTDEIMVGTFVSSILLFSVFIVDFVIKRNKLTGPNSFAILFFTLLIIVFPETLSNNNTVFCTLFVLFAIRRLLSMKSLKDCKLKIFDATLWILVSSIFYDWAVLYILLVFAAIYIYEPKNIRNWLVVISAGCSYFLILFAILSLLDKENFLTSHYRFTIDIDKIYSLKWWSSIKLSLYVLVNILLGVVTFLKLGKSGVGKIITMRLVSLSFLIGLVVNLFVSSEENFAIMITFFPCVIFITNYIESIKKPNLLEVVLILSIFLPLAAFVSKLMVS